MNVESSTSAVALSTSARRSSNPRAEHELIRCLALAAVDSVISPFNEIGERACEIGHQRADVIRPAEPRNDFEFIGEKTLTANGVFTYTYQGCAWLERVVG
jgi:hypothetical protein